MLTSYHILLAAVLLARPCRLVVCIGTYLGCATTVLAGMRSPSYYSILRSRGATRAFAATPFADGRHIALRAADRKILNLRDKRFYAAITSRLCTTRCPHPFCRACPTSLQYALPAPRYLESCGAGVVRKKGSSCAFRCFR
eukprot:IDg18705t1